VAYVVVVFNANGLSKWVGWLLSVPEMACYTHGFIVHPVVPRELQGSVANDYGEEFSKKHAINCSRSHLNARLRDLLSKGQLDEIFSLRPSDTENFTGRPDSKVFLRDRISHGTDEERIEIIKFRDTLVRTGQPLPASFLEIIEKALKEQAEVFKARADFQKEREADSP
jgi:hypothetical protein